MWPASQPEEWRPKTIGFVAKRDNKGLLQGTTSSPSRVDVYFDRKQKHADPLPRLVLGLNYMTWAHSLRKLRLELLPQIPPLPAQLHLHLLRAPTRQRPRRVFLLLLSTPHPKGSPKPLREPRCIDPLPSHPESRNFSCPRTTDKLDQARRHPPQPANWRPPPHALDPRSLGSVGGADAFETDVQRTSGLDWTRDEDRAGGITC